MEPDVGQSGFLQHRLHPVVGGAGTHRLREDSLADRMFLPLFQPLDGTGRQTDGAPALTGLGLTDLQFAFLWSIHRADNFQRPGVLIKVLPHETADLAPAQAGSEFGVEEVTPGLVLVHRVQKGVHLSAVQDLLGLVVALGQSGTVRGVVGNNFIA